jgi:AcrR family transcriptional regulator
MKTNALGEEAIPLALDATERLLIQVGYDRMSMDDVADEAGISARTLSLCFRNKGDLLLAREDRVSNVVKQTLQRIARKSGSWESKVREMLFARVLLRFDSVQHFPESLDAILRDIGPDLRDREELFCEEESKVLRSVLHRARKIAMLQPETSLKLADTLIAATNSLLPFHLTRRDLRRRNAIEAKIRQLIELVLQGLPGKSAATRTFLNS